MKLALLPFKMPRFFPIAVAVIAATVAIFVSMQPDGHVARAAVQPINFQRGFLTGSGSQFNQPTAMTVGPDGRLYVAQLDGTIRALTINPATMTVTSSQTVVTRPPGETYSVLGIGFSPIDPVSPPTLYASESTLFQGDLGDPYTGKIVRYSGANFSTKTTLISGLPVSSHAHELNNLLFDSTGRLFITAGGNSNAGVGIAGGGDGNWDETPLGGGVLTANIYAPGFDGNVTYDVYAPTATTNQTGGFGVSVWAPGFRNPYDLVLHSNGRLYATDNGPNNNFGEGSAQGCAQNQNGANPQSADELDIVVQNQYYGHPNRNRGRLDSRQCFYHAAEDGSGAGWTGPIALLPASSDGMVEYTTNNFGGQLQGNLFYVSWVDGTVGRIVLSGDGSSVVSHRQFDSGYANPLDIVTGPGGVLYVAEFSSGKIVELRPDETPVNSISVSSMFPAAGPTTGGLAVTISGTNFTTDADTTVTIGGQSLQNLQVQNSKTITGVSPAHAAGAVDVVVTNSIGSATLTNGFNYVVGGGTQPPVADAGPNQQSPPAHDTHAHFVLDARSSTDADGYITSYVWTENGVQFATGSLISVQLEVGIHVVTLTVTDNDGLTDTDDVFLTVDPNIAQATTWCPDTNLDYTIDSGDLQNVAAHFGASYPSPDFHTMNDTTRDRVINSGDLQRVASNFSGGCALIEQQILQVTQATEPYMDRNVALAQGFNQVTVFINGHGIHHLKSSRTNDGTFSLLQPEGFNYDEDGQLAAMFYFVPVWMPGNEIPPDGFDTVEDAWHLHNDFCIYPNLIVRENVAQDVCETGGGIWLENFGWMLHLWNYKINPSGRFVEVNSEVTR